MQIKHIILATILVVAVVAMVVVSVGEWRSSSLPDGRLLNPTTQLRINDTTLQVAVATSLREQALGLSRIESITDSEGMLFVYERPVQPSFWMKDMRFSIDIIWITNGAVTGIEHNVLPETYPQTFSPTLPITHVLEVSAGWSQKHGVQEGDKVLFVEGIL